MSYATWRCSLTLQEVAGVDVFPPEASLLFDVEGEPLGALDPLEACPGAPVEENSQLYYY